MAGTVWAKVWPDQKKNILVVSSLYDASIKTFGRDNLESRALPLCRSDPNVFFSKDEDEKVWLTQILRQTS